MAIDVKEAVRVALDYVQEFFEAEKLSDLGLEEVEKRNGAWLVTVGFSRPWDYPKNERPLLGSTGVFDELRAPRDPRPRRTYKVLRIDSDSGEVEALKNRESKS